MALNAGECLVVCACMAADKSSFLLWMAQCILGGLSMWFAFPAQGRETVCPLCTRVSLIGAYCAYVITNIHTHTHTHTSNLCLSPAWPDCLFKERWLRGEVLCFKTLVCVLFCFVWVLFVTRTNNIKRIKIKTSKREREAKRGRSRGEESKLHLKKMTQSWKGLLPHNWSFKNTLECHTAECLLHYNRHMCCVFKIARLNIDL